MPTLTAPLSKSFLANGESQYDLSVVIVSYNTRDVLDRCFRHLKEASSGLALEIIVVDNGSGDGSVAMIEAHHPEIRVIRSGVNLGFGVANNRAFLHASGRYIILLNSDAFLRPDALRRAVELMDANPQAGLGGGRLIGPEESWQPSARSFPSLLNDFLSLSGLAARFPDSRFFGRGDRTWNDAGQSAEVDWVPGAFAIVRPDALAAAGSFDESFFLYYEEVDLCRRIKALGYKILYWPDVVIVHLGGESSRTIGQQISRTGSQLTLWRLRSRLIYYRKHHGAAAYSAHLMELLWHRARWLRNSLGAGEERREKASESLTICAYARRAWKETRGGRVSPPAPW